MVDRRDTLRLAAAAGLGSAAGLVGPRAASASTDPRHAGVRHADWSALRRALSPGATLYLPGQASYEALAIPFNHRYADVRPAGILLPDTARDVAAAIRWARAHGVPLVPRSSLGHNYAGYSTTSGLLLILSRMRGITPHQASEPGPTERYGPIEVTRNAGLVTVGAGVINADMVPLLADDGILVPGGRCPTVGLAGLVLGGGMGFSDKMFGLTCDNLVSTTVALADGELVTCDERHDADLFWALRGGAGNNFGVNTSFTFRYERLRGQVAFWQFSWSLHSVVPALVALQEVAAAQLANPRFDCRYGLGTDGQTRAQIQSRIRVDALGGFYGSAEELTRIVAPVLDIGTPDERRANRDSIRQVTPSQAAALLAATTPTQQFAEKSAVLTRPLSTAQLQAAVCGLQDWPGSRNPQGAGFALFGEGGLVNQVPPDATAFVHRDGLFIQALETTWADDDPPETGRAGLAWLDGFYDAIFAAGRPRGAYQNFPDPTLVDWRRSYYGDNYRRLVGVKHAYDPTGFFSYPQGIGQRS
ncbi:FAD-binding oxidoreductase [Rugosimonospora acidiphila]|uniref:FAD-binding oxidoreductase n=1 Tax=Rugosimonospora acidiphila TaxID=556531 RepID=A0ABP9S569_9ACTN